MEAEALRRLLDEADCRALLMRYGPAVDWRDRASLDTIFWPDAEVDLGVFKGKGSDTPAFLMANAGQSRRRCHMTTSVSLRLEGDVAFAQCCSITHALSGAADASLMSHLFIGRYLDRLERRGGEWRIASRRYLLHGAVSEAYRESPALAGMLKADDLDPAHPLFVTA
ncbi:MAG: nuclear transport factor 2 family protein [Caulobacterales bacterium]|nr:nuclear transport factor 2 family protein [Caulobacterales bacterium]